MALHDDRRGKEVVDPRRDAAGGVLVLSLEQDHELVPAQAPDCGGRSDPLPQALPRGHQHLVARRVSEVVADRLETIEVEVQDRDGVPRAPSALQRALELPDEGGPVFQPGERVVRGLVLERDRQPGALHGQLPLLAQAEHDPVEHEQMQQRGPQQYPRGCRAGRRARRPR